jgi:hypothetical protein
MAADKVRMGVIGANCTGRIGSGTGVGGVGGVIMAYCRTSALGPKAISGNHFTVSFVCWLRLCVVASVT